MAFSLLTFLDDISSTLDDVAVLTKATAGKTAGLLGDDLALNAQQVAGVRAERELPIVWAVAKGSLVNKAILVPAALVLSALTPALITPLLMLGGSYLCYEGAEKIFHRLRQPQAQKAAAPKSSATPTSQTELEKKKISGAIRTDFVLSAEIVTIALASIPPEASLALRAGVMSLVGLLMTVGVYGLVTAIVKMDDAGAWLARKGEGRGLAKKVGNLLVNAMPGLMRFLTVTGTAAMFLVGGSILAHGLPRPGFLAALDSAQPTWLFSGLTDGLYGLAAGAVLLALIGALKALMGRLRKKEAG